MLTPILVLALACRPGPSEDPVHVDTDADGVPSDVDCNDADDTVFPGAAELCDGIDNDCDGDIDEDAVEATTWHADRDGDGYGDPDDAVSACDRPDGYVADATDCDDRSDLFHPGATEDDCTDPNDYDCDGSVGYADADADGFPACEDCDDTVAAVNPLATERCNGIDDDCDGGIDDDAVDASTFYADTDGDLHGDPEAATRACAAPTDHVADAGDCDDDDAAVHPGADERCNGIDDDCDDAVDEDAVDPGTFFLDADGDTWGDPAHTVAACTAPTDHVATAGDCDDTSDAVHPGADERCNGRDDDCDDAVDEDAVDPTVFHADDDDDGYGDPDAPIRACALPDDAADNDDDCDDTSGDVHPGAAEACDARDTDCNGIVDDVDDPPVWYADADADGFGDPDRPTATCARPPGHVADATDCDDDDDGAYPGAPEACDGTDADCDGAVDNDLDGDGLADHTCGGSDCDDDALDVGADPSGTCPEAATCSDVDGTGVHTIDPDGVAQGLPPYEAWCEDGWTLVGRQVPGDWFTLTSDDIGMGPDWNPDATFRFGDARIQAFAPEVGWKMVSSDAESGAVADVGWFSPSCFVEWERTVGEWGGGSFYEACAVAYTDADFVTVLGGRYTEGNCALGIGQNNSGAYCSMRMASCTASGNWGANGGAMPTLPEGTAMPCTPGQVTTHVVSLWVR